MHGPDLGKTEYFARRQSGARRRLPVIGLLLIACCLQACAVKSPVPWSTNIHPLEFQPSNPEGLIDERGRFREIFCQVLEARGSSLPDNMPCDRALTRVGFEPPPTGAPVSLGEAEHTFLVLLVPGLGYECVKDWLDHDRANPSHIERFGHRIELLKVDALSSSANNARQIRDFLVDLPPQPLNRSIVLIGYSKGAPDILEALATYPDLAKRVDSVIAYAGAVGGSHLAEDASQNQLALLTRVPRSECGEGDGGALESLRPAVRQNWLAEHSLPGNVDYYSVVSFPEPARISSGLRYAFNKLGRMADVRNDSQLVFSDQVIPGSTLLAFANADHWAMAVPVARQHPFASATFANRNNYPREAMLEALVRYLEEKRATPR